MTAAITDFSQFAALRRGAGRNDPAALRAVAGQFEALFLETMLKNMRETSQGEIFGHSDQYEMYRGMLDKQLSVEMASGRGIGLADMLVRQLGGKGGRPGGEVGTVPAAPGEFRLPASRTTGAVASLPVWSSPLDFVQDVWPHAERAAKKLNVAPEAILAQAALESGWGEHVMQRADGASSLNLFGIKAGADWQGASVSRSTIEYSDGVPRREQARFRAYPDIAATFEDYVQLLSEHPRYAKVRNTGDDSQRFARALAEAGYATDPDYADKIGSVLQGETMRDALGLLKDRRMSPITELR